jgi:hypothetical protein
MSKLDHKFGDDGLFWMSFKDMCHKFDVIYRTRLFDESWMIVQQWTSIHVPWIDGFSTTKFTFEIKKEGPVVVVLRQVSLTLYSATELSLLMRLIVGRPVLLGIARLVLVQSPVPTSRTRSRD